MPLLRLPIPSFSAKSDDLSKLDVEALPAGVRVVSAEYFENSYAVVESLKPHQTDGEGYTETGLRFGPGWIERVAGRSTGILDLKARIPQLEQQLAFDEVSVIRKGLISFVWNVSVLLQH